MDKKISTLIQTFKPSRDIENEILRYLDSYQDVKENIDLINLLHRGLYNKCSANYVKGLLEMGADSNGRRGGPREGWRGRSPIESAIAFQPSTCATFIRILVSMGADLKSVRYIPLLVLAPAPLILHKLASETEWIPNFDEFKMIMRCGVEHTFIFDLYIWTI